MITNSKVYDVLKWICITVMPALITLYGVIGATLNIPYTQEVLTIAAAVNTCLGAILGISNAKYYSKDVAEFNTMEE